MAFSHCVRVGADAVMKVNVGERLLGKGLGA